MKGKIEANKNEYQVDGEIGRFTFTTYRLEVAEEEVYNSRKDLFPQLTGKEWYITRGYKDIAFIYGSTEKSYNKTAKLINRMRYQPNATPLRTIQAQSEEEGKKVANFIKEKSEEILEEFRIDKPETKHKLYGNEIAKLIETQKVEQAIKKVAENEEKIEEMKKNPVVYEQKLESVNISIDDVVVKEQKANREELDKPKMKEGQEKKAKYVHNTVAHIEQANKSYLINGASTVAVLEIMLAFIMSNWLIDKKLIFFFDGQKTLASSILKRFSQFRQVQLILDWYHLEKKCKEYLSMALKGKESRNQTLAQLMPLLWNGLVNQGISYLANINPQLVKNEEYRDKLIKYLQHNFNYIACYSVRKELGLRNSSNRGEKENDLIVSERQKNNGMSWSRDGSLSLASLTSLKRNNQANLWFRSNSIDLKFAA